MLRKILMMAVVCLISAGTAFAQTGSLTGTVTDAKTGEPLVGANVFIPELSKGAPTDIDGNYTITDIPVGTYDIRISYIGYSEVTRSVEINEGSQELNIALTAGVELSEMVVTALGGEVNRNAVTFSSQEVKAEQLNVTQDANIKTSLAGKVSGLQIVGQAGTKLGESGDIRIRGAISLTNDLAEPLYVVDGVPGVNPNIVDMNNVEDVNVLKGPNATALYGQRGENGVIIITTKGADNSGVSVELNNTLTYEKVAYLPEYQNSYAQGYSGEADYAQFDYDPSFHPSYFEPLDGMHYIASSYADESWGPKIDGREYAPWYAWFPDSPYYGQSVPLEAHPDNIKDFYSGGVTNKASFAVNYAQDTYSARVSYANLDQSGLMPNSNLKKHYMNAQFDADITERFNIGVNFNYTLQDIEGDILSDGYGNQTSGSFNSWFGRQLDVEKMKELKNLKTPEGYYVSWNWWNPNNYAYGGGYQKPTFWYNSFTWVDQYFIGRDTNNLLLNVDASYELSDNWEIEASANRSTRDYHRRFEVPYSLEFSSAPNLYLPMENSFGILKDQSSENNYSGRLNYQDNFGDWSVDAFGGTNMRVEHWERFQADMSQTNYQSGGLIIPNVYQFNNSREQIVPNESDWDKEVFSLFAHANVGYKDMVYINGSYRQDWSSALPNDNNGYGYPSVGASFVFTELLESDVLSYGKLRAGWAQVGNDVAAERILGSYVLDNDPYVNPTNGQTTPLLYTDATRIDPNIKPAINSSFEVGADLQFFDNLLGLNIAYYNDIREDEIIPISLSTSTGQTGFLTNAGRSERQGIEVKMDVTPISNENFQWTTTFNIAHNYTEVVDLPQDLQTYQIDLGSDANAFSYVSITHEVGKEWGQLRGAGILRNENGQPVINDNGLYAVEQNQNFGSVLPDFTGGWLNNFNYKGFNLLAAIDFQKGGKFFSLSESWGQYSGLLEETADNNDLGNPKRDPVSEGGGVHVTGVDADGNPVDMYVPALSYYGQWYANRLAEPFVHDKTFVKLREVSLSYALPTDLIGGFLNSARIGVVGRNLWMIALSEDNKHNWDPSELSQVYGENGQLPGTRSFGVNLNITF